MNVNPPAGSKRNRATAFPGPLVPPPARECGSHEIEFSGDAAAAVQQLTPGCGTGIVRFNGMHIAHGDGVSLGQALNRVPTLQSVAFEGCRMVAGDLKDLLGALSAHNNLVTIELKLGDEVSQGIGAALSSLGTGFARLKNLHVASRSLQPVDIEEIVTHLMTRSRAGRPLEALSLSCVSIDSLRAWCGPQRHPVFLRRLNLCDLPLDREAELLPAIVKVLDGRGLEILGLRTLLTDGSSKAIELYRDENAEDVVIDGLADMTPSRVEPLSSHEASSHEEIDDADPHEFEVIPTTSLTEIRRDRILVEEKTLGMLETEHDATQVQLKLLDLQQQIQRAWGQVATLQRGLR